MPPWHPNFRNYEQLPDIKVVRTAFFVNGAAVLVALCLLVFLGRREYELYSLNSQIAVYQAQIDSNKADSDRAVALFHKFQEQEKRVAEIDAFMKSKPVVSDLLQRLGETRPKNIALDFIDIRAPEIPPGTLPSILLKASVRGASEMAASEVAAYQEILKDDPVLGPKFDTVEVTSSTRDVTNGRLHVEILIKFRPPGKPAAKPAAKAGAKA